MNTLAYSTTEKEAKKIKKFYKKHFAACGGYKQITFSETGVGTKITVRCPVCMKDKDVTDYSNW
jgi:hypothetical protein